MASKKNSIVAKANVSTLEKAGVETKLTKMEIADYIATKAKEELQNRVNEVQQELGNYQQKGVPFSEHLTDLQKEYVSLYCKIHNQKIDVNSASLIIGWGRDGSFAIGFRYSHTDFFGGGMKIPLTDDQKNLPIVKKLGNMQNEYADMVERIHNLDKKSHRTLLVEQILSGSESGKKVLSDLAVMINRAVSGS